MKQIGKTQPNLSSALVALGTTKMTDGEIYKIQYINSFGHTDYLLGLGTGEGVGPDYYTILSSRREFLVSSIVTSLPDISSAIFGSVYLLVDGDKVYRCHLSEEGQEWEMEEVQGDHILTCLSDSGMYLLSGGRVKKLSDSLVITDPSQAILDKLTNLEDNYAKIVRLTQDEYDNLEEYDPNTLYIIND